MEGLRTEPFVLQEISRRSIVIGKIFGGCMQWGNSPLTVLTDKGLSIFDYTYIITNLQKKIALVEFCVPCKKTSPASQIFPKKLTQHTISGFNYNQMLIDPSLWPHNPEFINELAAVTSFQWSPPQLQLDNMCLLATVTNLGHLELYGHQRYGWKSVFDLSELVKNFYKVEASVQRIGKSMENLEAMKRLALILQTSTLCWCPSVSDGIKGYLVSAQKNSDLLFWTITSDNVTLNADLILKHELNAGEIISLQWIPLSDNHFLLTYANLLGQLFGLECEIQDGAINTKKIVSLWVSQDRMVVKHIKYMFNNENLVIVFSKHRNLIVQTLNESFTILSQCQKNINQSKITNLTQNRNNLHVGTVNRKIYRVIITFADNNLDIQFSLIKTKDAYETSDMVSFGISQNRAIWALCLCDRRLTYRKYQKFEVVFLIADNQQAELQALLNNPSNSLQEMWDCLELLRYKCLKSRNLPQLDYDQLYAESQSDIYKLKLYLHLITIYNSDEVIAVTSKCQLPETSIEKVKEIILLKQAQMLRAKFAKYQVLKGMDLESFTCASRYIKQFHEKYKCMTEENKEELCNIDYKSPENRCESCDEVLEGFICKNGHMNMFCSITLTPIVGDDYIYCKACGATARIELHPKKVTCVFCDICLNAQ